MQIRINKEGIPWAMAAGRALLGPVLIVGEKYGWNGLPLASLVVTALVSDIFDGVLARRWRCDTAAVRLFDSMADTAFYVCAAIALWIGQPQIWREHAALLATLGALEAIRFSVDFAKFGKPASYHSYLAKTWGLIMATALVAVFASSSASQLVPVALLFGIACDLEGLSMSLLLPVWRKDVKTLRAAWLLRGQIMGKARQQRFVGRTTIAAGSVSLALCLMAAAPAYAVEPGHAAYWGGSAPVARDTVGSLDMTSPTELRFQYKKADGTAGQVEMQYAKVSSIELTQETKFHLGALPWVAVSLVAHPQERYLVTIHYTDTEGTAQIAAFEVAHRDQRLIVEIVNARAPHNCGVRNAPCPVLAPALTAAKR